jgi:hypothetical protein
VTADVNGPDGACVGRGCSKISLWRNARNWAAQPLKLQVKEAPETDRFLEHPQIRNPRNPVKLDGRRPADQARPMTDEKEKKPLERLNTANGRRELRAMLREIMAAAPDPADRGHVANALLERLGIVLLDSTLIDITAFKGWFDGAYEAMLDDYPKRDEDR